MDCVTNNIVCHKNENGSFTLVGHNGSLSPSDHKFARKVGDKLSVDVGVQIPWATPRRKNDLSLMHWKFGAEDRQCGGKASYTVNAFI